MQSPPTNDTAPKRPCEDALLESVSYYLENYDGRGVPETIIREMHQTLLPRLYDAGRYRQTQVHIEGAIITPPEAHQVGWLMREAQDSLRNELATATAEYQKRLAIVKFFHSFNAIHPFRDGNGRVSRAVLHLLLRQQGCLETRNDFYDFFALRRDEYLEAMKDADRGEIYPIYLFIVIGSADATLKDFLEHPFHERIRPLLSRRWQDWYDPVVRSKVELADFFKIESEFSEVVSSALNSLSD